MADKGVIPLGPGGGFPEEIPRGDVDPDVIQEIVWDFPEDMSLKDRRAELLRRGGRVGRKKKYATATDRYQAQLARQKAKREEERTFLERFAPEIAPKRRGAPRTREDEALYRKTRQKNQADFLRRMATENPEVAKQFGIDPSRFGKTGPKSDE